MDFRTICVHGSDKRYDVTGAVSVPIFQSATFAHPGVNRSTGYDYSRTQNPTREYLEAAIARLEGGSDALAFSSGMAAVALVMELFSPGDHIIASDDLYGGSIRLFANPSAARGLKFTYSDAYDAASLASALTPATKALFIETPSNPMMHVVDIAAAAEFASAHGLLLVVDNTFMTPYFQRPLELGADIVIHSGTKYLCGHNDTLCGFAVVKDAGLSERLRFLFKTIGPCLAPFDSWLLIRSLKTLALRMEAQQSNARELAEWLLTQPKIKAVHYPGLPEHPQYDISRRQASGFGAMLSFSADTPETAVGILERVRLILYAESLGGVESLITYPMLQTHADIPEAEREAKGIDGCLLRLSVGIESPDDLIADLDHAINGR
ncbi:MAG: PLP-dependent aspartate aminotransferase family protein [Oscillospiraceae bacterium]|jgi:cystathionine beta-lyase/cystathionine gamma-synthase|nr:PLP-dependent aspartate aminotransferase family protein [Oscillospiraceae bacterium]